MFGKTVAARDDLLGGGGNRVCNLGIQHAQLNIGLCGRVLDAGKGLDLLGFKNRAGEGEVLDGSLRLSAVQCGGGHADLAHGVVFDPVLGGGGHELVPSMVLVLVVVVVVLAVGWVQVSCDGSGVLLWWSHAVFIKLP